MEIIFEDSFDGSGLLSEHLADTGQGWAGNSQVVISDGAAQRASGYSPYQAYVALLTTLYSADAFEVLVEVEVIPGTTSGTNDVVLSVADPDGEWGFGFSLQVGSNGYCRLKSTNLPSTVDWVVSTGSESEARTHNIRLVCAAGSTDVELYANGYWAGTATHSAAFGTDAIVSMNFSPNRTVGYIPLLKVNRITVNGVPYIDGGDGENGAFWTHLIRTTETP